VIPLRDNIPSRTRPIVNISMIVLCSIVFFAQLSTPSNEPPLYERYGMIPARIMHPDQPVLVKEPVLVRLSNGTVAARTVERALAPAGVPAWLTIVTCIFLHGGWMHFLGNMWFLWIFGDNVEDRFGHVGYLLFYLATGVLAGLSHLVTDPSSVTPTIGASGAIAGVMGAYFLLYPRAMVMAAIPLFVFIEIMVLPAWVFLGLWFVIQFAMGAGSLGSEETSGVAWWAHIGGFAAGLLVALALRHWHGLRPRVEFVRPHTEHPGFYRIDLPRRSRRRW